MELKITIDEEKIKREVLEEVEKTYNKYSGEYRTFKDNIAHYIQRAVADEYYKQHKEELLNSISIEEIKGLLPYKVIDVVKEKLDSRY